MFVFIPIKVWHRINRSSSLLCPPTGKRPSSERKEYNEKASRVTASTYLYTTGRRRMVGRLPPKGRFPSSKEMSNWAGDQAPLPRWEYFRQSVGSTDALRSTRIDLARKKHVLGQSFNSHPSWNNLAAQNTMRRNTQVDIYHRVIQNEIKYKKRFLTFLYKKNFIKTLWRVQNSEDRGYLGHFLLKVT